MMIASKERRACGKGISINSDEVNFYNLLVCPRCGALLEIVAEDTLTVEEVPSKS
jgi:lysine biosynthesis protein LysW